MLVHSSSLAWESPWTEEPGGLQPMGLQSWTRPSTRAWQVYQGIFICVSSPRGWYFGTKTWPHPAVCRIQCWKHLRPNNKWAWADRLPKDFLNSVTSRHTPWYSPAHQRVKTRLHPPIGRHWLLLSGSLHKALDQPHPPGDRHRSKKTSIQQLVEPSPQMQIKIYPGTSWPLSLEWWGASVLLEHVGYPLQRATSKWLRNIINLPHT